MRLFLGHGFSVCYLLVNVVVWCTWVLGMGMHWFLRHMDFEFFTFTSQCC